MPIKSSLDSLITTHAMQFAHNLRSAADRAHNEEEVKIESEKQLAFIQKDAGIKLEGRHEFTLAHGRVDSVYSRVIIEYKNPKSAADRIGPSSEAPGSKKVIKQIKERFNAMQEEHGHPLTSLLGVGLDGNRIIFVRFYGRKWHVQEPTNLDRYSAEKFLWALFNLGQKGKPFSPDFLAEDFGSEGSSSLAVQGINCLYGLICGTTDPKAQTFFNQWKILFGEVCGYDVDHPTDKLRKLAEYYGIQPQNLKAPEILFAVHTYYALFMKLLAAELVAFFHKLPTPLQKLIQASTSNRLRREMNELEAGSIFRHIGITNFLEGDLFSWYTSAWSAEVENLVRKMAGKLDEYNPGTLSEDPDQSRDLLKKLYQQLFPKNVRHDLGEYYTPDWLAEHVLNEVGYSGDPDKRLLDPGCGSGTFLVMAIARIRKWYDERRETCRFDEGELCRKVLANVIGFDLNPLAVMAARTNYLIAIRDLIPSGASVEIPVYLCDSIVTPSEYGGEEQENMFGQAMRLKTSARPSPFLIPKEVTTSQNTLGKYTGLLAQMTPSGSGFDANDFINSCIDEGITITSNDDHKKLFEDIRELDIQGKNGIWARIIKNAFAPLFVGMVDFVAGNPPWVNWDSLPEDYRNETKPLWLKNGLFTLSGTAGRLGGGKKDIAMLFVYEGIRNYLKPKGRLGYVITQSIFKTEGAADGFRRFELNYGAGKQPEPFCVYKVDDLSSLKPFEGAANRTAVLCIERGKSTHYPLDYPLWMPCKSATIPKSLSLSEVNDIITRIGLKARPIYEGKQTAPWLTVCPAAIGPVAKVVGSSSYKAQAGATTCGGDGVFLVRAI